MPHPMYYLSADRRTQIVATITDETHKKLWGRMSYSSKPFGKLYRNPVLVEVADPVQWIEDEVQARQDGIRPHWEYEAKRPSDFEAFSQIMGW